MDISQALQQQVYGLLDGHAMEHYMAVAAPTLQQVRRRSVALQLYLQSSGASAALTGG